MTARGKNVKLQTLATEVCHICYSFLPLLLISVGRNLRLR